MPQRIPNFVVVFILALVAGAGWHFGYSLVQTGVNSINAWLARREAVRRAEAEKAAEAVRIARVMAETARIDAERKANPPQRPTYIVIGPHDGNLN
jgi:Tfp pilus assembly protein PilO